MVKRIFDIISSFTGLVVLSPLFLLSAILVKSSDGGPVFYKGIRVGLKGVFFEMLKFRTMVLNADKIGGPSTSDDDSRITKAGKILRKYKLDELPQLINVLMGDMSFVGPRPEVVSEVEAYTEEERKVLSVRPGITDWASIKFYNEGEILRGSAEPHQAYIEKIRPEKIRLQLEYARNHSMIIDIKILWQTFTTLFTAKI